MTEKNTDPDPSTFRNNADDRHGNTIEGIALLWASRSDRLRLYAVDVQRSDYGTVRRYAFVRWTQDEAWRVSVSLAHRETEDIVDVVIDAMEARDRARRERSAKHRTVNAREQLEAARQRRLPMPDPVEIKADRGGRGDR